MSDELPLAGVTIGITADRRAEEQADLLRRRGAGVLFGPTMRTIDLGSDDRLRDATAAVIAERPAYVLTTTGYGVRLWLSAADGWGLRDDLLAALGTARVAARGPKSASALRQAGVEPWWRSGTERMDDVVARALEEDLRDRTVAMLLDGYDRDDHAAALEDAGAAVVTVPLYRWAPPDDPEPARRLVEAACDATLAAVTFTSQPAVRNLFAIASEAGRAAELRGALNGRVLAVCVGPVCAEAAAAEGVRDPAWPEPARLAPMVRLVAERLAGTGTRRR